MTNKITCNMVAILVISCKTRGARGAKFNKFCVNYRDTV